MHIKIGTRSSKLALWQSHHVMEQLKKAYPLHTYEIVEIRTKGDKIQDVSLQKIGDKGLFVKEIEEQLLNHSIDMAVHSMKDMPSLLPEGLCFSKTLAREDARDVLILREGVKLSDLKHPVIGTGSLRRMTQIKAFMNDVIIKDIRGNVDTRIRKLDNGDYDGIIMAAAGLKRLGLQSRISHYFTVEDMIPASAQGALAIETRSDEVDIISMLNTLSNQEDHDCVMVERAFLAAMDGNCHVPVGAYCRKDNSTYHLSAMYGDDIEHVRMFHGSNANKQVLLKEAIQAVKEERNS